VATREQKSGFANGTHELAEVHELLDSALQGCHDACSCTFGLLQLFDLWKCRGLAGVVAAAVLVEHSVDAVVTRLRHPEKLEQPQPLAEDLVEVHDGLLGGSAIHRVEGLGFRV
jgi:hypothetical protein